MNTKLIIAIVVAALGLAIWSARPGTREPLPEPMLGSPGALTASEMQFGFGSIRMADGKVSKEVTITNSSSAPVTLGKLFTSCMCTTAGLDVGGKKYGPYGMQGHGYIPRTGAQLGAGQTARMIVTFDPNAHGPAGVGRIERTVTLEYGEQETLAVNFSAEVTP